jgi:L-amino acid N-acyltransferase YncA
MDEYIIDQLNDNDLSDVTDLFNYYALNTTFDFSDQPHDPGQIKALFPSHTHLPGYTVKVKQVIIGFGLAYPFRPEKTFFNTVKFTYWFKPEWTGKGLGTNIYELLKQQCRLTGIKHILVNISSDNLKSIRFHERKGFIVCGKFRNIIEKSGRQLDMIWMQKDL